MKIQNPHNPHGMSFEEQVQHAWKLRDRDISDEENITRMSNAFGIPETIVVLIVSEVEDE